MSNQPSSSSASESIRRSKRKRSEFDVVAAANGNNQKKSKQMLDFDDSDTDLDEDKYESTDTPVMRALLRNSRTDDSEERNRKHSGEENTETSASRMPLVKPEIRTKSGRHECPKCPAHYDNVRGLANHKKMHSEKKRAFVCTVCDFSSVTEKYLKKHTVLHQPSAEVVALKSLLRAPGSRKPFPPSVSFQDDCKAASPSPPGSQPVELLPADADGNVECLEEHLVVNQAKADPSVTGSTEGSSDPTPSAFSSAEVVPSMSAIRAPGSRKPFPLCIDFEDDSEDDTPTPPENQPVELLPAQADDHVAEDDADRQEEVAVRRSTRTSHQIVQIPAARVIKKREKTVRKPKAVLDDLQLPESSLPVSSAPVKPQKKIRSAVLMKQMVAEMMKTSMSANRHETIIHKHQCKECPYGSSIENELRDHQLSHTGPSDARPFNCSDCSFAVNDAAILLNHVALHDNESGRPVEPMSAERDDGRVHCKNCTFSAVSAEKLALHAALHRQDLVNTLNLVVMKKLSARQFQQQKMCPSINKTSWSLWVRTAKPKACKSCVFECYMQSSYVEHIDRHGYRQKHMCTVCDYSDNSKILVDFHEKYHHSKQMARGPGTGAVLDCMFCRFKCDEKKSLAHHITVHHGRAPGGHEIALTLLMPLL
ncbi:unnamed protein product [Caenorhabditis sp. 36 PRJEB53466]|nr:unnamed protein product [Caenorhabditis sp. 36 PRJEB53466]